MMCQSVKEKSVRVEKGNDVSVEQKKVLEWKREMMCQSVKEKNVTEYKREKSVRVEREMMCQCGKSVRVERRNDVLEQKREMMCQRVRKCQSKIGLIFT